MSVVIVNDGIFVGEKNFRWGKVYFYKKLCCMFCVIIFSVDGNIF